MPRVLRTIAAQRSSRPGRMVHNRIDRLCKLAKESSGRLHKTNKTHHKIAMRSASAETSTRQVLVEGHKCLASMLPEAIAANAAPTVYGFASDG